MSSKEEMISLLMGVIMVKFNGKLEINQEDMKQLSELDFDNLEIKKTEDHKGGFVLSIKEKPKQEYYKHLRVTAKEIIENEDHTADIGKSQGWDYQSFEKISIKEVCDFIKSCKGVVNLQWETRGVNHVQAIPQLVKVDEHLLKLEVRMFFQQGFMYNEVFGTLQEG